MSECQTSPNVYGIETEYSCMVTMPNDTTIELTGSCHGGEFRIGLGQEPACSHLDSFQTGDFIAPLEDIGLYCNYEGMLSNGARLYTDPSGPEYATPECSTAEEAVLRSFDGDAIVLKVFDRFRQAGSITSFQFNRRNVDHNRVSRGVHLNTMANFDLDTTDEAGTKALATLNVVKGAVFGSGGLLLNKQGETEFHHSPRLSITEKLAANAALHELRPLVRKPFKNDGHAMYRVETITSDALNFAWPLRASLVATNALIGLIELGKASSLPRLFNPVRDAKHIGQYGNNFLAYYSHSGKNKVSLPAEILQLICEQSLAAHERHGHLDAESLQVLPEIIGVCDLVNRDDPAAATYVESIARKLAMERKMEKDGLSWGSEQLCRFDYAFDCLSGGIAERWRERTQIGWAGFTMDNSPSAQKRRRFTPPRDTRAFTRGELIKKAHGNNSSDWTMIGEGRSFPYTPPLKR